MTEQVTSLEEVRLRHEKEKRDLSSRITQKKKSATKKNRKTVNEECADLERKLAERQQDELLKPQHGLAADAAEQNLPEELDLAAIIDAENGKQKEIPTKMNSLNNTSSGIPESEVSASRNRSKKTSRQKARLARKTAQHEALVSQAEEEAANLPDLKKQERSRMLEQITKHDLQEKEVAANGHCMYLAIADQLNGRDSQNTSPNLEAENATTGLPGPDYKVLRKAAATYIDSNPEDFSPFVEEPLPDYTRKIRETGEWGGELELMALSKAYNLEIKVLRADGSIHVVGDGEPKGAGANNTIWLAYYKHGFGLGEHYNSLHHKSKSPVELP